MNYKKEKYLSTFKKHFFSGHALANGPATKKKFFLYTLKREFGRGKTPGSNTFLEYSKNFQIFKIYFTPIGWTLLHSMGKWNCVPLQLKILKLIFKTFSPLCICSMVRMGVVRALSQSHTWDNWSSFKCCTLEKFLYISSFTFFTISKIKKLVSFSSLWDFSIQTLFCRLTLPFEY